jgi:caffeoyl-CoA O-methyltransferase
MMNKHLISSALLQYCETNSNQEPDYLYQLSRETNITQAQPHMLSGHLQGRFLSMISNIIQPKNILEIGTYTGYAALCLAEGLPPNGRLITIDIDAEKKQIAEKYFAKSPFQHAIQMMIGNALEIIPSLNYTFDLVFIDADKINYLKYYQLLMTKLKSGAIILIDNVLFNGDVINDIKSKNAQAVEECNAFIATDKRIQKVMLPIRDGITMIRVL